MATVKLLRTSIITSCELYSTWLAAAVPTGALQSRSLLEEEDMLSS